jgi:hypothetical protein
VLVGTRVAAALARLGMSVVDLVAAALDPGEESTALLDEVSAPTPDAHPCDPFGQEQRDRYVDSGAR